MVSLKSKREMELMREASRRLKVVFEELKKTVRPGLTTGELDEKAGRLMASENVKPAFKDYKGYPAFICTSLNEVVVHGIPSKHVRLKSGDLLSVDIGIIYEDYFSDAARSWAVGRVDEAAKRLMEVARKALYVGMAEMSAGKRVGDISNAIQSYVESHGCSVVRDFVGHGIGRALHEDPQVPNFGTAGKGPKLEAGMVLALEPMVIQGRHEVEILDDSWTVVTRDRSLAAHYEDTIALTENGAVNLTGPQAYREIEE